MNDLNLVLQQVILRHEDDTVRLAYADLLQERGGPGDEERAEFIRVQIELFRLPTEALIPSESATTRYDQLSHREYVLRGTQEYGGDWYSNVWEWFAKYGWENFSTTRGFLGEVKCSAQTFLRHADELIWYPDQKVQCGECEEFNLLRRYDPTIGNPGHRCRSCGFPTGSVNKSRPCPPTAQPVRRVVLTTEPDWSAPDAHIIWAGMRHPDRTGDTFHCDRFPGIEFVLPPGSGDAQVGSQSEYQSYP